MARCLLCGVDDGCSERGADGGVGGYVDIYGFVSFRVIDSDNNGYVSRVEARSVTGVEEVFNAADANGDGLLDREEYRRVRPGSALRK